MVSRPRQSEWTPARRPALCAALALPVAGTFAEVGLGMPAIANLALTALGAAALILFVHASLSRAR